MVYIWGFLLLFTGCAPGPPPPPPVLPGFGWLIIGLVIFLGVTLWKSYSARDPLNTNYLTESLNAINKRLKELEKKIEEMEQKLNQEK